MEAEGQWQADLAGISEAAGLLAAAWRKSVLNKLALRTAPWLQCQSLIAGWSSPVARQAHNLKVVGSNPAPATNLIAIKPL